MIKEIDGMKINYTCRGEGELVVLLHGWGANITLFENVIDFISTKYKVLAMDMPGFGLSSEPSQPWCVDDYVRFVTKFIAEFGADEVILLGHSFGGRVIIKMCSLPDRPFAVRKVILTDSAGVMPKKSGVENSAVMKLAKKVLNSEKANKLAPNAIEKLRKMRGSADYNAASPIMRKTLVNVVNEDLTALMPAMTMPVLLVWGSLDTATPLEDAKLMESLMPEAGLAVFEGAGHYSFLDQPERFNRVLAVFLKI